MGGACGTSGEKIKAYGILVGKPGQRPLARFRRRSQDNIKRDFTKTGYNAVGLIHVTRKGISENGKKSSCSMKCGELPD